jgi:hypothetical protein
VSEHEPKSEVARLRLQIRLEYEAAMRGLCGLAQGTAQHAFITRRMENMAVYHESLKELVGEHEASKMLAETLEQAGDGGA